MFNIMLRWPKTGDFNVTGRCENSSVTERGLWCELYLVGMGIVAAVFPVGFTAVAGLDWYSSSSALLRTVTGLCDLDVLAQDRIACV